MKQRIVILGGGFGGIYTALELEKALAKDSNLKITLGTSPMPHEVAASDLDITTIVDSIGTFQWDLSQSEAVLIVTAEGFAGDRVDRGVSLEERRHKDK